LDGLSDKRHCLPLYNPLPRCFGVADKLFSTLDTKFFVAFDALNMIVYDVVDLR
jgi:hypothetical protein